ncbi:uncharacterized protein LOC143058177 [Mytilus galloprovincialis]|uniref:uncharacterized protein LOC143058177 n=1 Tax=Mytilus galloprovincialis TaxID=29158 RepID=UPI003F7BB5DD
MRVWPNMMYGDIYNFLVESKAVDGQQMKNFKSLQSFNYFQSGNVGVTTHYINNNKTIMFKGEVRSSQTVSRTNEVFVLCVACTDETAKWNRGTTRNVEPKQGKI